MPAGVDYNMWLGPAPNRPFNPNRFHFNFRWFWDYAGGLMTDWGVHLINMMLMGVGNEAPSRARRERRLMPAVSRPSRWGYNRMINLERRCPYVHVQ